jgi:hypothetical protein
LPKSSRRKKTLAIRSGKSDGMAVSFAKLPPDDKARCHFDRLGDDIDL